jgi:hypothetical protein
MLTVTKNTFPMHRSAHLRPLSGDLIQRLKRPLVTAGSGVGVHLNASTRRYNSFGLADP